MARLQAARRIPLAISGAVRRFAEDPWRGRVALERAVPGLRSAAPGDDLARRVDRAVAEDRLPEAEAALAMMPEGDPDRASCAMSVNRARGHLTEVVADPTPGRRAARVRALARRQQAELGSPLPVWAAVKTPRPMVTQPGPARILHVVTNSLPLTQAGSTIRTQGIVSAQRAAGWDARVVTRPGYPVTHGALDAADVEWLDGVPYFRLLPLLMPAEANMADCYRRSLTEFVREWRPHLLHGASDHVNARAALEVGRREGIPVAYEVRAFHEDTWSSRHGGDAARDTEVYRLLRDRHTEVMLAADLVTTLSAGMRADIVSRGVDPDRVVVTPNAVPVALLEGRRSAREARAALGLDEAFWAGTVATLHAAEGIDVLIMALAVLRARGIDARGLVVGDGPVLADLRALAAEQGVPLVSPGRVPVSVARDYHDALDVFVLPRTDTAVNREVTPLKPLEAQARGRPVVGSDLPAVAEVLVPGSPLVPPGDHEALAEALAGLLDPEERRRLGDAGHAWVASCRTWPSVADAYGAAYSSLGVPTALGDAT
ncbi:MAG: glycosyltransferase family 4 protein [Candidatus Nanopelagicales bacterium]